jgi:hypothetical protein
VLVDDGFEYLLYFLNKKSTLTFICFIQCIFFLLCLCS